MVLDGLQLGSYTKHVTLGSFWRYSSDKPYRPQVALQAKHACFKQNLSSTKKSKEAKDIVSGKKILSQFYIVTPKR